MQRKKCYVKKTVVCIILLFFTMILGSVSAAAKTYEENGFSYRVSKKEAIITGTERSDSQLVIPDTLGGFPVTEIGYRAFRKSKCSTISIPATVREVGDNAFSNCSQLKEIRLPQNLQELGEYSFSGCTKLTTVSFGQGIATVEEGTFKNCISLKKVSLPSSVKKIKESAFYNCYKLSSVQFSQKLRSIGNYAFYRNYALKSIRIPSKVSSVGERAFYACSDLVSVRFANDKTELGEGVFSHCTSMKKAVLPGKIKSVPESAFSDCTKLSKVKLPKTVSIIKKRAFANCSSLKSFTPNDKAYAIGDQSFSGSGLRKINMNSNMQFIGNGAFQGTNLRSITLKSNVTFIGNRVFANCEKLKSINIPSSVKGINPGAFNNCVSLQKINVAAGNANYCSANGVLYDKSKTKLIQYPLHKTNRSFRTPGSLKYIRSNAFSGNSYLQNVTISADSIGANAFSEMEELRSVRILSGTKKIENDVFSENRNLTKIEIPDSVISIGNRVFARTKIQTVHIPSHLTSLSEDAFLKCNHLSSFTGGTGGKYRVQDGVLYNRSLTALIKYPSQKSAKEFTLPNSVKEVKSSAFENVSYLEKLYFGKNFRSLRYCAIMNAKNLKSMVFESKKISSGSAEGVTSCERLAVIVGPNTSTMRRMAREANATLITL